jgi:hypothetical protein
MDGTETFLAITRTADAIDITLQAVPTVGYSFDFKDLGAVGNGAVTFLRNGSLIEGQASNYVVPKNALAWGRFTYVDNIVGWVLEYKHLATTALPGEVPQHPNDVNQVLRGDLTWGVATGTAGSAPAIDANHQYVYSLTEAAGSTTLANTGNGANGTLTLAGVSGTDYVIASKAIGRALSSYRGLKTGTTLGGASSGTACSVAGGSITLECFVRLSQDNTGTASIISVDAGTANDWMCIQSTSVGVYYAAIGIGGAYSFTTNWNPQPYLFTPLHLMATYDAVTGALKLYSNGVVVASASLAPAPLATMTRVNVGAFGPIYSTQSFLGWVTQARVSNVARDAAYALATAETLLGM